MHHGIQPAIWEEAKAEAKAVIADRARVRGMIPYSELCQRITATRFEPHSPALFGLLGEISREEAAAGRGMMSALVVHKVGDMQPGPGFFELAKEMGRDTTDILACWVSEFKKVHEAWARPSRRS